MDYKLQSDILYNLDTEKTSDRILFVHISHTDMDGYGCNVIADVALSLNPGQHTKTAININQPSELNDVVRDVISGNTIPWDPNEKALLLLITDLADLDPMIFESANNAGRPCAYLYLDHHKNRYYNSEDDLYTFPAGVDLSRTITIPHTDIQVKIHKYLVNEYASATLQLYDWIVKGIWERKGYWDHHESAYKKAMILTGKLSRFAALVSKYDMGDWDDWDPAWPLDKWAEEIKLQFTFSSCRFNKGIGVQRWLSGIENLIMSESHNLDRRQISSILNAFGKYALDSIEQLAANYRKFQKHMELRVASFNMEFSYATGPVDMQVFPDILYGIYNQTGDGNDAIGHFSMISKKILENNTNIDLILLRTYGEKRKTMELRSRKGSNVNCAAIAKLNGGGGHFNAAGFPIKE